MEQQGNPANHFFVVPISAVQIPNSSWFVYYNNQVEPSLRVLASIVIVAVAGRIGDKKTLIDQ